MQRAQKPSPADEDDQLPPPRRRLAAFRWQPAGESPPVGAVVVDHEPLLHPPHLPPLMSVQLLLEPGPRHAVGVGPAHASICLQIPVEGPERRLRPVRLLQPAPRRPALRVPQAAADPHRLALRERHPLVLAVLEVPYGDPVDEEAENKKKKTMNARRRRRRRVRVSAAYMMCCGFQRMEYVWKFFVGSNQR